MKSPGYFLTGLYLFVFNDCKVAVGSQLPRRINRRMASYVTVDTTQKTDKKTSQCIHVIK
jgi:hypothetical protein